MKYTLHTDDGWELRGTDEEDFFLEYWLTHKCGELYVHRFGDKIGVEGESTLDIPCEECKSVCPAGLRGMYMALTML